MTGVQTCALPIYKVKPKDAKEIVEKTVAAGEPVSRLLYKNEVRERVRSQDENY